MTTPPAFMAGANAPELVVRAPILFPNRSVNQTLPSGPAVMPLGPLEDVGTLYSVMAPAEVIRPMLFPFCSVNHKAPSDPAVIPAGRLDGVGVRYSKTAPVRVIRPI